MKIGEAHSFIREGLREIYDADERAAIAQLVLEDCTTQSRTFLLLNKNFALSAEQEEKLRNCLSRLQQYEPVQYVLNKAWFYDMELYVDNAVLIPRPETEELVEWIVRDVKNKGLAVFERGPMQADATTELKILDVGTGSGCIALALKKVLPKAEVWGCDSSEEALNVARRNGASQNIRVDFQGTNFLDESQQKSLPTVDILVSNPPYIPLRDKETMRPNVLNFEPHTALFVPTDDALLFYKAIAQFAKSRLAEDGSIYLEIHEDLSTEVVDLFYREGYRDVELRKDMQGKDRMVKVISSGRGV
ncbi:peptide chain release factor N(5)-glutamine methyltransferase [Flavisolibacter nicotianae]|uniref:peptide chain release factor N(5)-glutamine methyltransferase n=1 Tax=Flavisolibacter nicotianae TaxID=2364882 RepID=UPI000EAE0A6E|nr:peptide chain release factor N(5)-glutamine methyltransferase [Flavisolibacter nicotianae]